MLRFTRTIASAATLATLVGACAKDSDPLDTMTGAASGAAGSGVSATDPGGSTGGDPTTGASASGGGTTGDPPLTREICDKYLDCVAVATPEALPSAQMGFGPEGTCWDGPPESQEQCIQACAAGLESLHQSYPQYPQCAECVEDVDCPPGQRCSLSGECNPPACGDGVIDPGEICDDGGDACWNCETGPFPCNPWTDAGCDAGEQCSLDYFACVSGNFPPLGDGHSCDPDANNFCGHGLVCMDPSVIMGCPSAGCCTLLCDLSKPNDCPDGRTCVDYYGSGTIVGVCALI